MDDKQREKLARRRIFGVAAHIDAGKTTVSERMLYVAGVQYRPGLVDEGTATMDFEDEERERGITIHSAAIDLGWGDRELTLVDTPGHVDFTAEVERCLRVLDGMILVLDSSKGVEAQTETVWRQALAHDVSRIGFLNKLDKVGADVARSLQSIRDRLGVEPIPVQEVIGVGEERLRIADLIHRKVLSYEGRGADAVLVAEAWDGELGARLEASRALLCEAVANLDEGLVERYLAEESLSAEELDAGVRRLTLAGRALPILFGAALRGIGVEPLLDGIVRFLPSPLDRPRPRGRERGSGRPVVLQPDPAAPLVAQVFKLVASRHGNVAWVRIYQGRLEAGDQVRNTRLGKPERAQSLLRILAGDTEQVAEAGPGDIVAIKGFRHARTGDGITAPGADVDFPSWTFPLPVLSRSVETRKVGDRDRLLECLDLYAAQDPTFDWKQDEETGQILISGMGELHLEVLSHALARDFKVDCVLGTPRVAYRETLAAPVRLDEEVRLKLPAREVAVRIAVELIPDEGLDKCAAEDALLVPEGQDKRFAQIREVARHALELELRAGPGHGFPMTQVRGRVLRCETPEGGPPSTDDVEIAVSLLLRGLAARSELRILEPWMKVAVTSPEEFLSPALAEIQALGGQVQLVEVRQPWAEVRATGPLSRLLDFTTRLRSVTQGRAAASMELEAYHPVPAEVREALLGD